VCNTDVMGWFCRPQAESQYGSQSRSILVSRLRRSDGLINGNAIKDTVCVQRAMDLVRTVGQRMCWSGRYDWEGHMVATDLNGLDCAF
jgi:hypothetical protein